MARPKSKTLTEREAQIMEVLWQQGQATADDVRSALPGRPHDSSVRTLLRVLESKGHVRHDAQGKTYVYYPVIVRDHAQRNAVKHLLERFFGGSAESLVLGLLENEQMTAEELSELLRSVSKPKKKRPKGGRP